MAFPQVQSVTETTTSGATSHNIQMPATVNAGDLLLMLVICSSNTITGTPSGWTAVRSGAGQDPIYAKVAIGDEDGGTVAITTSDSQNIAAQVYRITDWYGEIANGVATTSATGTSTNPNPPSLNPAAWGTEDTLWIASAVMVGSQTFSSYPSSYTNGTATLATSARLGSARRARNAASEDPGTFTITLSTSWRAHTIAIRPADAPILFTGSAEVSFDGTVNVDAVSDIVFTGSGALDFDGTAQVTQIAVMDGAEEVSFDGTVVLSGGALLLVGDGDVSFDGSVSLNQDAVFEGFGDVTMNGLVNMGVIREFAASQSVSFDGSANLTAIGWQEVDIASSQIWTVKK